jgi:hypothetical protein
VVEAMNAKRKATCLERYGVESVTQSEDMKAKSRETCQEKYGVDNPTQSPEIREKTKKTCLEKYGVENPGQSPELQIKAEQTNLELYGVRRYNQLPEMREYLRINCPKWMAESYANPWNKGIVRPEAWTEKQRQTISKLITDGVWRSGYPTSKKGYCKPSKSLTEYVYFRSSYEAIYCFHLDHNDLVESFRVEPFSIDYVFEGVTRSYTPDFLVNWKDGSSSVKEIKPTFMAEDLQVLAKAEVATLFANQQSMDFEILICKDIKNLNVNFDDLIKSGYATLG